MTCQWCGYPEHTHAIRAPFYPHRFESSSCDDDWHNHVHGWGATCEMCSMTTTFYFGIMLRYIPIAKEMFA